MKMVICRCVVIALTLIGSVAAARADAEDERKETDRQACVRFLGRQELGRVSALPCSVVRRLATSAPDPSTCDGLNETRLQRIKLELREREALICSDIRVSEEEQPGPKTSSIPPAATGGTPKGKQKAPVAASEDRPTKEATAQARTIKQVDPSGMVAQARGQLNAASQRYIAVRDRCAAAKPCSADLQRERDDLKRELVLSMGLYLRLAGRWAKDIDEASKVTELGLIDDDPAEIGSILAAAHARGMNSKEIEAVSSVLDGANSEEERNKLTLRLRAVNSVEYQPILDELGREKPDRTRLKMILAGMRRTELKQLFGFVGNVSKLDQARRALWNRPMLVIMAPPTDSQCSGADNVLRGVESYLTGPSGIRRPLEVAVDRFEDALKWAKCQCGRPRAECGDAPVPALANLSTEPGDCQAVLGVRASEANGVGHVSADLQIILPEGAEAHGTPLAQTAFLDFAPGCGENAAQEQDKIAAELVARIAYKFDYIADLPRLEPATRSILVPTQGLDVKVQALREHGDLLSEQRGKGLRLRGQCGNPDFRIGVQRVLQAKERLVGGITEDQKAPLLQIQGDADGRGCTLSLKHPLDNHEMVAVAGLVSPHPWESAGAGAANALVAYYEAGDSAPRPRWVTAPRSLLLSGMPQLTDDNPANNVWGWTLAGVDIAMLAAGTATLGASIAERNNFSQGGDSARLDHANTLQNLGWGLLITAATERILNGVFYGFGWLDPKPSTGAKAP